MSLNTTHTYTYVLNNPLKYTDPSGYSSQDFYDEEARMTSNRGDSDKTEAGGSYHFFAGYDPRTGRFNPYHRYSGFSASFPGASMVGRFVRYNGPTGVYYDKSTKSVQYTYQDYLTGSAYRNVEYVKDYYNVTTDSEGNKSYTYMYTVDDGVRKVPVEASNIEDAYSIGNAVNWLNENSHPTYAEAKAAGDGIACARFIRYALEAGFNLERDALLGKTPVPARQYGVFLESQNFTLIDPKDFLSGDIAVIQGYPGGSADENGIPYGHIQMFNGSQWISNYFQPGFWPGRGYRQYTPSYSIYRWIPGQ